MGEGKKEPAPPAAREAVTLVPRSPDQAMTTTLGFQQYIEQTNGFAVRTIERDGQVWFVAKDVCNALGLTNPTAAVRSLHEDEKGLTTSKTLGGAQQMVTVNEPGLYRLIFQSRKESAEVFKRWVFHEVLPTIRKTGAYSTGLEARVEALAEEIKALTPKKGRPKKGVDESARARPFEEITGAVGLLLSKYGNKTTHIGAVNMFTRNLWASLQSLADEQCISMEDDQPAKDYVTAMRSFDSKHDLEQGLLMFASAYPQWLRKLRSQGGREMYWEVWPQDIARYGKFDW
jgi:prophage antirepressor-like protein